MIADGHHRYETSLARTARAPADGAPARRYDLTLCFVVELVEDQLTVQPIHRLVSGLPDGPELPDLLSVSFELAEAGPVTDPPSSPP